MYMLRYKFREAADLQGGGGGGGGQQISKGGECPPPPKCSPAHYKISCDVPFIPLQDVL